VPNNADVVVLDTESTKKMLNDSVRTLQMKTRTISRSSAVPAESVEIMLKERKITETLKAGKVYNMRKR
jgi:hypothetical protein